MYVFLHINMLMVASQTKDHLQGPPAVYESPVKNHCLKFIYI